MAIEERIKEAIANALGNKKVFERLEEQSMIKASSWQAMLYGRQRATSEMIEFICRALPEYAYWMVTGIVPSKGTEHKYVEKKSSVKIKTTLNEVLIKEAVDLSEAEINWLNNQLSMIEGQLSAEEMTAIRIILWAREKSALMKDALEDFKTIFGKNKTVQGALKLFPEVKNAKKD